MFTFIQNSMINEVGLQNVNEQLIKLGSNELENINEKKNLTIFNLLVFEKRIKFNDMKLDEERNKIMDKKMKIKPILTQVEVKKEINCINKYPICVKDINYKNDINQYSIDEINKNIKRSYENKKKLKNMEEKNKFMNYNFNYKRTKESPHKNNRNNLNHTNDNLYESKMFSIDNEFDSDKNRYKNNRNNEDKSFQRNIDVSSIYSDKNTNLDKSNKSFTGNNRLCFKNNNNFKFGNSYRYKMNNNNNQSFY
jgi:hypothetical protein